jgi:alcohol dehydrogenase (NADP+)
VRAPAHFAIPIPDAIPSELAASMMCAGVTVYSPLKRNGAGPGKTVGVVGLGGLGHFAVLWAKAMGADKVVVVSRGSNKRADALALGADDLIATGEGDNWTKEWASKLDILLSTVSSSKVPMSDYLSLLRPGGVMVQVGLPEDGKFEVGAMPLIRGARLEGSLVGSPGEIQEMLQLAAEKGVKPWVQTRPMAEANQAILDMENGKARYRYVLVNEAGN